MTPDRWLAKTDWVFNFNRTVLSLGMTETLLGTGLLVSSNSVYLSTLAVGLLMDGARRISKSERFFSRFVRQMEDGNIYIISRDVVDKANSEGGNK